MEIKYSDGAAVETRVHELVEHAARLESDYPLASEQYGEWPVQYHLSPERSNLVRHLDFSGLDVLELGAGMGAVSRHIAESAKSLTVVEGTRARYAVLQSRLRDLKNWSGIVSNIQDAEIPSRFDVVCVVGVLEYSELYVSPPADFTGGPFAWFLKKAVSWLKPDGVLVLAIENKLGLKYWSGAAEDHSGRLFDGICGYPVGKSAKTFSRSELLALLNGAGLSSIEEQFPFPDYKIPSCVITRALADGAPELAAGLASGRPYRNYGQPRLRFFPDTLAIRNVCHAGLLPELSNSFLYCASARPDSPTRQHVLRRCLSGEVAWHYSNFRRVPTTTVFRADGAGQPVRVRKEALRPGESTELVVTGPRFAVRWRPMPGAPAATGMPLKHLLSNHFYFEKAKAAYDELRRFLGWSFRHWPNGSDRATLEGEALDAILTNAVCRDSSKEFELFDLEWSLDRPMARSWFVFRNVLGLQLDTELFPAESPFTSLEALYLALCADLGVKADPSGDLALEAELQGLVTNDPNTERHRASLAELFSRSISGGAYPRRPVLKDDSLRATLKELPVRVARRLGKELKDPKLVKKALLLAKAKLRPE